MNLCIDVGNNQTSVALFKNGGLVRFKTINNNKIPKKLSFISKSGKYMPIKAVISSVVPIIKLKIMRFLEDFDHLQVMTVSPNSINGIRFKYKNINKLGNDRIINAYGAYCLMSGDCLVADFGTAVTYDFISKRAFSREV
jgi:type III pantothenate kinase